MQAVRRLKAAVYDTAIVSMTSGWYAAVVESLAPSCRLLDVGIGTGAALLANADAVRERDLRIVGIDIDRAYVERCRDGIAATGLDDSIEVRLESVYDHGGGPYDAVYFSGSFMLLPDPAAALRHVAGLLAPGARVYFTQTFEHERSRVLERLKPALRWITTIDFGAVTYEDEMLGTLAAAGFEVERRTTLHAGRKRSSVLVVAARRGDGATASSARTPGRRLAPLPCAAVVLGVALAGVCRAAPDPGPLRPEIVDCWPGGSSSTCSTVQGAHWFYAFGGVLPPPGQIVPPFESRTPTFVVSVAEDRTTVVHAPDSPGIPQPVRASFPRPEPQDRCSSLTDPDSRWQTCPFPEIEFGGAVHQVLPLGILRIEKGRYRVSQPSFDEAEVRRLAPRFQYGVENDAERMVQWLRDGALVPVLGEYLQRDARLWFALQGGFSEGEGTFGGLAVYDLATSTWKIHYGLELLESFVTSMIVVDDALWMGTAHRGEYAVYGISGLVRFDFGSGGFRAFSPTKDDAPAVSMVRRDRRPRRSTPGTGAVAPRGCIPAGALSAGAPTAPAATPPLAQRPASPPEPLALWVGTSERGLSLFHSESGNWENWRWEDAPDGSGVPFRLGFEARTSQTP